MFSLVVLACTSAPAAAVRAPGEVAVRVSPEVPGLKATLVVRRTSYALDPRLADPAVVARLRALEPPAKAGSGPRDLPVEPPAIDAVLRLTNTSREPIGLLDGGDMSYRRLKLTGPGAITVLGEGDYTEIFMCGRLVRLEPGATVELPLRDLRFGNRPDALAAYWTAAGTYTLEYGLDTRVLRGADLADSCGRGSAVSLRAAPVTLTITRP